MKRLTPSNVAILLVAAAALAPQWSWAAAPSALQALKLTPSQANVDYDQPSPEQAAKCKIVAKKIAGHVGWIVESPDGVILRKFVDTNDNNVVDQWSYYKDGIEVYRDIDSNHNGKVDQCRWFNTGGSRWGICSRENGVIDAWKSISAEEVSAEIVAAIATHDAQRFNRLLLTPGELRSLGLGKSRADGIAEKLTKAATEFKDVSFRQKTISPDTVWVQFSANHPGIVPAGTDQSTRDLRVYENVVAIVEGGGKHGQLQIGTLVQVGDVWRVIDMPGDTPSGGFFFQASLPARNDAAPEGASETLQKLLTALSTLDGEAAKADTPEKQGEYTGRRADLLLQIADAAKTPDDRSMWIRQLADMISGAVQTGSCPDGADRLKSLSEKLQRNNADKNLAAYVKFRQLTAGYALSMQAPKADFAKIQADWQKTLEQFVSDYPGTPDAAEAMLQLAMTQEYSGQDDDARKWYARIVKDFPDSSAGKKAAGAQARLDSVGQAIAVSGQSPLGSPVDSASYRGKVVLIQYWATWSAPSKADMPTLKELWNKYGRNFTIVGISLDNNPDKLKAYLAENPLPWPQIFEEGGLDSRPANMLGILTVPTMLLLDQQGKVVNRNISAADLETEIKKLIR
jgi:thiol-disulfide isomerase/thioredoxin